MTFSEDYNKMVVTEIVYNKNDKIYFSPDGLHFYNTKLMYSDYNKRRKGWTGLSPVFINSEAASYTYPFLFNNSRSLLFAANMVNGYGGFDIYLSHWNDSLQVWGNPVNLGEEINTSGNEIAPAVFEDILYFASNGQIGYGGYDIYSMAWDGEKVIPGTLKHYEYPINTEYNDFLISPASREQGYLVSDRYNYGKDNIYAYKVYTKPVVIEPERKEEPVARPEKPIPETICSVYFEFDKYDLDHKALQKLNKLIESMNRDSIEYIEIVGYADPVGSMHYNCELSEKRAASVAAFFYRNNILVPQDVDYVGSTELSPEELKMREEELTGQLGDAFNRMSDSRKKRLLYKEARRVDIKVIYSGLRKNQE